MNSLTPPEPMAKASFLKRHLRVIIGLTAFLIALGSITVFVAIFNDDSMPVISRTMDSKPIEKEALRTTEPTLTSDTSSVIILGTVLSHETANIYPRRDGIVEDIYVDIGDNVTKGQVVALLLPKGVEGQSAAIIAEKQARKAQAEADYLSAQSVKEETLLTTKQKISEKETELLIAKREQQSLLERFTELETNILQTQEQAHTAVRTARQVIEQMLTGTNARTGANLDEDDLLDQLGLLNFQTRYHSLFAFNALDNAEKSYRATHDIDGLINLADAALLALLDALNATPTVPNPQPGMFTQESLGLQTTRVLNTQESILKAKENLQDARNALENATAAEWELYQAYRSDDPSRAQSNKVRMIEEQLRTSQSTLELTEANQEQMVERYRQMVGVADAMLRAESTQSGHRQIISPFSGTVSKRFIDVGKTVTPSMTAFELTDVPTTLAKKAKAEIKFGLPEDMIDAVQIGDTVTFFLQSDETTPLSAEVTRKSPQVDLQSHTVTVQAKISDEARLPHGTSVRIRLTDESTPVFSVPSSSVKREEDSNYVWILEDDQPRQLPVSVISEDGEFAQITGKLEETMQIILSSPDLFAPDDSPTMP